MARRHRRCACRRLPRRRIPVRAADRRLRGARLTAADRRRLPGRRPAPAGGRDRRVRPHRLAPRPLVVRDRRGVRRGRDRRRHVPLPGDARLLRRWRAARCAVAGLDLPARLGGVGVDGRAPGARHQRPALDDRARRLHADWPRGARVRQPGQGPQRPRRRARDRHAARRDLAHGPDLRRQRPDGGRVDPGGADRRADRPRQPPSPDARPRRRPRRPRRAHDRAVRPRRLQELQRRLRPPRRRRAARPPRPRARARGRRVAARPTASAATSSASCSTASTTRPSAC